jgi:hypothetical protein
MDGIIFKTERDDGEGLSVVNMSWYQCSSRSPKSNSNRSSLSSLFELQLIHDPWAAVGDRVLMLRGFSFLSLGNRFFLPLSLFPAFPR